MSRSGQALIEAAAAALIVAFLAVPVMALLLSARRSDGRQARRAAAAASMRRLSEALKGYVAADARLAAGPGVGPGGWSLPGDRSGSTALAEGVHELDPALWAAELSSCSAVLRYSVRSAPTPDGLLPSVSFNLSWREP